MSHQRIGRLRRDSLTLATIGPICIMAACDSVPPRPRVPATLTISSSRDTLSYGTLSSLDSVYLVAAVADENGLPYEDDSVTWVSSRSSMLITPTGRRTATVTFGSFTPGVEVFQITASLASGPQTPKHTYAIVACGVDEITIRFTDRIVVGNAGLVSVRPADGPEPSLSSTNEAVLSLDGLQADAVAPGATTLEATVCGHTATRQVSVVPKTEGYSVTPVNVPWPTENGFPPSVRIRLTADGRVLAVSREARTVTVWTNGTLVTADLGTCTPLDVNEAVQVLCDGNGPTIWENGVTTIRDTVTLSPFAITSAGHVVAYEMILWRGPGDAVRTVCAPQSAFVCELITASNQRGDILTSCCQAGGLGLQQYLWRPDIDYPWPLVGGSVARATAINDSGDVVGYNTGRIDPSVSGRGFIRKASEHWMSHDLPIESPISINNAGEMISATAAYGASVDWLDQMLADPSWDILEAALINDERKILARALNKSSGDTVLVLLTPGV